MTLTHTFKVTPFFDGEYLRNGTTYDTIRYDSVYLTYSKKLTGSQLSLPHGHRDLHTPYAAVSFRMILRNLEWPWVT